MAAALALIPHVAWGQQPQQAQADSLRQAITQLTARLDSLEAGQCPTGPAVVLPARRAGEPPAADSLAVAMEQLNARLERVITARCPAAAGVPRAQPADTSDDLAALRAAAAAAAEAPPTRCRVPRSPTPLPVRPRPDHAAPTCSTPRSARPVMFASSRKTKRREPQRRSPGVRVRLPVDLDPYSKTKIFLTFEDDEVGVEEGYIYYAGLPGRIRADVGKFRQPIGDLNRRHLHACRGRVPAGVPALPRRGRPERGRGVALHRAAGVDRGRDARDLAAGHDGRKRAALRRRHPFTPLARLQNFWQLSRSTYTQVGFTATGGNTDDGDLRSRLLGLVSA